LLSRTSKGEVRVMGYTNVGVEPVGCVGCSYVGIELVSYVG